MADIDLLQSLCSVPTAPFAEGHVVKFVEEFVAARASRLKLSRDEFGNLLIELRTPARGPRWVFTAHMDHPAFVAERMLDRRTLSAVFRGYVLPEYFKGERVRFFTAGGEVVGVVKDFTVGKDRPVPDKVRLKVDAAIPAGAVGMFDQGEGRLEGDRFLSRVCDDLAGAAAALEMLDQLTRKPLRVPVAVLLTRGEEDGFVGAIAASIEPKLLKKSDRLIAIECSAQQPFAPQGNGVIIRIGDRTSVFNSSLSYFLAEQAGLLAKKDKTFRHQRALMPGGTCEATVYDVYGFAAASMCVPLGNYHNMDATAKKIGPEYVDVNDWRNMVKLFVRVARFAHTYEPGHQALKKRLEQRFAKRKKLLGSGAKPHAGS